MNKIIKIFIIVITCLALHNCSKSEIIEINEWQTFFDEVKVNGTFVLSKLDSDTLFVHNVKRMNKSYLPASTFKIPNSLISLETKVISDENEIIKWDGVKRFYDKWNQDQNLKSAIKFSCVWFYQELARRVGEDQMQHYLNLSKYGNGKIGTDIDKFWLEGDLRISATQQIKFLNDFLHKKLPFESKNIDIVKSILIVDSTKDYKMFAKTGWAARAEDDIGWYVGFVERGQATWVFALNIDIVESSDSKYRKELSRLILRDRGIIE